MNRTVDLHDISGMATISTPGVTGASIQALHRGAVDTIARRSLIIGLDSDMRNVGAIRLHQGTDVRMYIDRLR